jgi:parvulin-like peptidyl-prolyl isomerase
MVTVETFFRKQREREKLQSMLLASVQVPESEVLQRFTDQNIKYEADYIFFDLNTLVKDEEVKPTDDDLRKYYNDHSKEYKVEASRKLKYVFFNLAPSLKDSEEVANEVDDIYKRSTSGTDFLDLAKTYSETPVNDSVWFKHGELSLEKETAVFGAQPGTILSPTKEFDGYHLIKVFEFRSGKDDFIRASHVLIRIENNDSAKALKEAKDVYAAAKRGEDFAELARKHSKDGSASQGGDLGWFGKGRMVPPFEDAAFKAKAGQIVGPVRTQFGYHVIKVVARDNREARITELHLPIHVSAQTRGDAEQRTQDFAYLAKQGDFVKEAGQEKYNVSETPSFLKNTAIPGVGSNPGLNKFAFNNKLGSISDVIALPSGFGVYMISEIKEAGIRPFEELKDNITVFVKREQKMKKLKALAGELRQSLKPGDKLNVISAKRPDLPVNHLPSFALTTGVPGFGRDQALIGAVSALTVGEISQPIEGARGVFLLDLTSKSPFDSTSFTAQKNSLRTQLITEKRNQFLADWSEQLKKSADIVDNRDIFFH